MLAGTSIWIRPVNNCTKELDPESAFSQLLRLQNLTAKFNLVKARLRTEESVEMLKKLLYTDAREILQWIKILKRNKMLQFGPLMSDEDEDDGKYDVNSQDITFLSEALKVVPVRVLNFSCGAELTENDVVVLARGLVENRGIVDLNLSMF